MTKMFTVYILGGVFVVMCVCLAFGSWAGAIARDQRNEECFDYLSCMRSADAAISVAYADYFVNRAKVFLLAEAIEKRG